MFRSALYIVLITAILSLCGTANAAYRNQFSFHVGAANSAKKFGAYGGAEFEHRLGRGVGIGLLGNYIALSPNTALLGAPEFFLHPSGSNWFINIAPIFQTQLSKTSIGVRTGTRFLLFSSKILKIQLRFEADFINGGKRYLAGAGIEFHTI